MVFTWLKLAKKKKSHLPLSKAIRSKERKALCAAMGWKTWKQDIMRHTAASMMLAQTGEVEKTAFALGNSEAITRPSDAQGIFRLAPSVAILQFRHKRESSRFN